MCNHWVISWLVIDYCLWSLGNRWVIDRPQNLQSLITHRLNWLVVDCTDYSSISSRGCKWHFHEAIRKKENTLNVTLMTFSDFIGLNNNIIIGSNCWGRSGWIFSLAPLLNQTLTTLVISWLSLENSSNRFKIPLDTHKVQHLYSNGVIVKLFCYHYEINENVQSKMKSICWEHRFVCICLRRDNSRVFLDESVSPAL